MPRRQHLLFDLPPKRRPIVMHVVDAGSNPCKGHPHVAQFRCGKCGHESEWHPMPTITSIKRGLPCPVCNDLPADEERTE